MEKQGTYIGTARGTSKLDQKNIGSRWVRASYVLMIGARWVREIYARTTVYFVGAFLYPRKGYTASLLVI